MTTIHGIIHGNTIELDREPGFPDGAMVAVSIRLAQKHLPDSKRSNFPSVESWADRLIFDSTVHPGERIVKGTTISAEAIVSEIEQGRRDEEIMEAHRELSPEDVACLREYAKTPVAIRRTFGAWSEDANELDTFLKWNRERRAARRRGIDE